MIAVTFALPNESSDFVRLLRKPECPYAGEVRVLHTGVGEAATLSRLGEFLKRETPRLLISCGFAGAVGSDLAVGDLLLAENFSEPSLGHGLPHVRRGILVTAHDVVDSATDRAAIAQRHNAIAVDMETEFIAEICAQHSVPMISLRAISDTPAAPFGIPTVLLFDITRQRTPYFALVFHLLRHPRAIGKLSALARQVSQARRALTGGLDQLLRVL